MQPGVGVPSGRQPPGHATRLGGVDRATRAWHQAGHTVPLLLGRRERVAVASALYLLPIVLVLLGVWLARDLWPPFRQVTVLFFLGWLLAFILDPLVEWLVRRFPRLSRGLAAATVFFVLAGVVIAIGAWMTTSILDSLRGLDQQGFTLSDRAEQSLAPLEDWAASLGFSLDARTLVGEMVNTLETQLGRSVEDAVASGLVVVGNGITVVFIAIVMIASKAALLLFVRRVVPADQLTLFDRFSAAVARSFGGFIRGQFGLAALYGALVSLIALVFGVPFVPIIGVATLLLQTIPWFGQLVSWIPLVAITVLFQPGALLPVAVLMLAGWLALQNVISPRVLGASVGLNPLVVLAAVFLGGAIAGPLGAVFGVPAVAAVASVFTAWLDVVRPARRVPPARNVRSRARRTAGRAPSGACLPRRTSGD